MRTLDTFKKFRILLIALTVILGCGANAFADVQELIADIERAATLEGEDGEKLYKLIISRVEKDTAGVAAAILPRLNNDGISDRALIIYIGVLGTVKAREAVDEICRIGQETESDDVEFLCWTALSEIGGEKSGECLLTTLDNIPDPSDRYIIFSLLGQMQYEGAFPMILEILESDAKEFYYRPIFVFGKMGDMAVPHLLEKVHDNNVNVRYNAIGVLGQWLMAPEATEPMQAQFWKEEDPVIRNLILSSLENTNSDFETLITFMEKVISKTDDKDSKIFAEETVQLLKNRPALIKEIKAAKKISPEKFETQYDIIWDSYGHEGDYEILFSASTFDDEPALKKLRQRILLRNSDEAFYDYDKVKNIIRFNRILNSR
jgi:hypothetical protein